MLCKNCGCDINSLKVQLTQVNVPHCLNTSMLYNVQNRLLLGKSTICPSLGLFAGRSFKANEFIGEYVGEINGYYEGERRDKIYRKIDVYYVFLLEQNLVSLFSFFF